MGRFRWKRGVSCSRIVRPIREDAPMEPDLVRTAQPYDAKAMVVIRYTNYRAETSIRRVVPIRIRFASSEWHPAEQWIMDAFDLDRQAERSFALADVHEWNVTLADAAH